MMRSMKRYWSSYGALGLCLIGQACSSDEGSAGRAVSADNGNPMASIGEEPTGEGASVGATPSGPAGLTDDGSDVSTGTAAPADLTAPPLEQGGGTVPVEPGTLTAGAWDDNRNIDRFLEYRAELYATQMAGLLGLTEDEHLEAQATPALGSQTTLDVALVIDTTGSMGDELRYLQTEFDALSLAIEESYPLAEQRWALVVYRDTGDAYVTRSFDFEASAATFRASLGAQSSGGGGDVPEASDAALEAMNQLSWRAEQTARLAFWVGDAPHHGSRAGALTSAIRGARDQGIHLYPVASSGVDELTELSMRSAAQLTLGRYLFLTDDSGVGGDHKEPSIPCYFVTRLNDAILRMVQIEMSGVYREPDPTKIIRMGGSPADGACVLDSGQTVFAY
jgi:hypothetical protein